MIIICPLRKFKAVDSILDDLYKIKYGNKPIEDYTDYYTLSMTDEYIDMTHTFRSMILSLK